MFTVIFAFLCGALGAVGYFSYTGSTLKWKK